MQTGQVQGITSGLLYTSKNTSVKSTGGSFEQLMQLSQKAAVPEVKTENEPATQVNEPEKEETVPDTENAAVTTETPEETENSKLMKKEKATVKSDVSETEQAELVASLLWQVTELVQNALNLSEEELNAFMEQMGITAADLLNMETVQNLFLVVKQQDAVMLLTDAELFGQVQQLMAQVETILSEAGITPEEVLNLLTEPEFEAMVQEAIQTVMQQENEETTVVESDSVPEKAEPVTDEKAKEPAATLTEEKSTSIEFRAETKQSDNRHSEGDATKNDMYAEQFVQNLQKAAENVEGISVKTDVAAQIREIADQILERIKVTITPEITSMDIVLTPEELGRVNLTVSEQDGVMKASFVTENEVAKEAIESNLVQFKEMLVEQGLKVDSIEVTVGNFEFDKNGEAGTSNQEEKKNSKHHFDADAGVEQAAEADQLAQHFMDGGESTVNYMV